MNYLVRGVATQRLGCTCIHIVFTHKNKIRKGDMIRSKTVKGMNAFTTVTPLSGVSSLKSRHTNREAVLVLSARGF